MKIKETGKKLLGRLKNKKSGKFLIIGVLAVALVTVGVITFAGSNTAANASVTYQVVSLKTGDLQKYVSGSGTLAAGTETSVLAPVALSITSIVAESGESVQAGDVIANIDIATLDSEISALRSEIKSLDNTIKNLSADNDSTDIITSSMPGRVKQIYAKAGDEVNTVLTENGALLVLSTDGKLKFSFTLKEATTLEIGDTLDVTIPNVDTYEGTVQGVSSDRKTVTVTITDNGPKVGAKATAALDGTTLGAGTLAINHPITVTASGGTVSKLYVDENDKVYSGTSLLKVKNLPDSEDYASTVAQRTAKANALVYAQQIQAAGALVAPRDGIISSSSLKTNGSVNKGASMFTLSSSKTMDLTVSIDELDISSISVGQTATVSVDAVSDKTYNATVKSISQVGTASNGVTNYDVKLSLPDADDALRIGMNATATIVTEESKNVLMVPLSALQSNGSEQYVWVYTGSLPSDTSQDPGQKVTVTTGLSNDSYAEVKSGLTSDDQVVVVTVKSTSSDSTSGNMNLGGLSGMTGPQGGGMQRNDGGAPPDKSSNGSSN
ncbi:MAG: efflux RND transporter periplasmic adaptor subunit [Bacillota bacterium]